jgi:hypothetical protein
MRRREFIAGMAATAAMSFARPVLGQNLPSRRWAIPFRQRYPDRGRSDHRATILAFVANCRSIIGAYSAAVILTDR